MTAVRFLLFPVLLGGSMLGAWAGSRAGIPAPVWSFAVTVANLVMVAALEQLLPRRRDVSLFHDRQSPNDLLHAGVLSLVGVPIGQALGSVVAGSLTGLAGEAGPRLGWPAGWHPVAQFVLLVLLADFFDYWKHRAYHGVDWLWRFHAIHHASRPIHALKAGRLHFAEGILRYAVVGAPLALLGAPAELLLWYALFDNVRGNLNHTNLDLRFPRFAHYLLPTLDFHYVHHGRESHQQRANLASTPLWDLVFGTFLDPTRHPVHDVGIEEDPVPPGFFAQLAFPFRRGQLARDRGAPS